LSGVVERHITGGQGAEGGGHGGSVGEQTNLGGVEWRDGVPVCGVGGIEADGLDASDGKSRSACGCGGS